METSTVFSEIANTFSADWLVTDQQSRSLSRAHIGGKAYHLAQLQRAGFLTPSFFVLKVDFFQSLVKEFDRPIGVQSREAFAEFLRTKSLLFAMFKNQLAAVLDTTAVWSIRSSAVAEDGSDFSYAGIFSSFLYQTGLQAVSESIIQVISSAFSERAYNYVQRPSPMAVIIQRMIDAEKSGVLFTINSSEGKYSELHISASYGIGEGVVSGVSDCDEFYVHKKTNFLRSRIADKKQYCIRNASGLGTEEASVPESLRLKEVLTPEEVIRLTELGLKIENKFLSPQDVEWCLYQNQLYVLQTRPLTKVAPSTDRSFVFDNSNIQESFNGVTTPLTFSYASEAYRQVYSQLMKVMGFSQKEVSRHDWRHQHMLGLVSGRVYYNIDQWYAGLLFLPGFNKQKEDMEAMMGLEQPVNFIQSRSFTWFEKLQQVPRLILLSARLLIQFAKIDSSVRRFESWFHDLYSQYGRDQFSSCETSELHSRLREFQQKSLKEWGTPIVNDFYVMMSSGKVRRQLQEVHLSSEYASLLAGEDLESLKPTLCLMKMAQEVKEKGYPIHQASDIQKLEEEIYFSKKFADYIELYGDRVMGELKLEVKTLREDRQFLYEMLAQMVIHSNFSAEELHEKEQRTRKRSEEKVRNKIHSQLGSSAWKSFEKSLKALRKGVKHREALRLYRTRVFGLVRSYYLEIGKRWVAAGILDDVQDIFFLSEQEISDYFYGKSYHQNLRPLVRIRKDEKTFFEGKDLGGQVHLALPASSHQPMPSQSFSQVADDGTLCGIGCYPGTIQGEVQFVQSPEQMQGLQGKILLALRTDPGWTPLFTIVKGLIIEKGSALSHSAVIAREMGIPAVVGVSQATQRISTGEKVELNGYDGSIKRLI
jgi:pyruvate,water dikinase